MAGVTGIAGWNVVSRFATPTVAIVARRTIARDKTVIKGERDPVRGRVTLRAGRGRRGVRCGFSGGKFVVVATGTGCGCVGKLAANMAALASQVRVRT